MKRAAEVILILLSIVGGTGCGNRDVLLRFDGKNYPITLLDKEVRQSGPLPRDVAERQSVVDNAVNSIKLRLWAASQPLGKDERSRLEDQWRNRRISACIDAHLKRRFNTAGDFSELAREFFTTHRQDFAEPERFLLQMIFLPADDPDTPRLADELLKKTRRNPDRFGELARTYSKSRTAERNGETGILVGTMVHPALRAAVAAHRNSREAFRVDIDRGVYILRIHEYVDAVEPTFHAVRSAVMQKVRDQLATEFFDTVAEDIEKHHRVVVEDRIFLHPAPPEDSVVYRFDERVFRVGDLLDPNNRPSEVTGRTVHELFAAHRRWLYFSGYFDCTSTLHAGPSDEELAALRIPSLLRSFAAENLRDTVIDWARGEGLSRSRAYTVDLYAFPFRRTDPYADLVEYRPLIERIRSGNGSTDGAALDEDILVATDVEIDEEGLFNYEPGLIQGLRLLEDGQCSNYFRSGSLKAFLVICMKEHRPERALDPGSTEDMEWALRHLLPRRNRQVVDAVLEDIDDRFELNREAVEAYVNSVSAEDTTS